MAKLTREQVIKMNSKCENGFKFDTQYYIFHNEKTLKKLIDLGNDKVLEVKLMYRSEYKSFTNENGCTYNKATGMQQPTLHMSVYKVNNETGCGVSYGLGKWVNVGEAQSKMLFSALQKLTAQFNNDDELLKLAEVTREEHTEIIIPIEEVKEEVKTVEVVETQETIAEAPAVEETEGVTLGYEKRPELLVGNLENNQALEVKKGDKLRMYVYNDATVNGVHAYDRIENYEVLAIRQGKDGRRVKVHNLDLNYDCTLLIDKSQSKIEIMAESKPVEKIEEPTTIAEPKETQATNTTEFAVVEDVHTKTGEKVYIARLIKTVSRAEFINISIRIKPLGGYYSRFKKGFLFKENPTEALKKEFNNINNAVNETISQTQEVKEVQPIQQTEIKINEDLARQSKQNMSFDDYKEGSATQEYNRVVENMAQKINEAKEQVKDDSEKISQLDYLLTKFKKDYANWTNKKNANGSSHVSWIISGRGNYNMNKHNKYVAREGKLWAEYNDIMAIDSKIDKIVYSKKIIKSDDKDALDKLKEKLAEEQKAHDEMVNYNKQARKDKKEVYPTYMLSNSSQRIKNIKDRIKQLEKLEELKQTKGNTEIEINGIKIIDNLEANRVQMIFPDKPCEEVRKILKSNGFRWSPSFGAWQRNRNSLSMMKAKNIAESLKDNNSIAV